MIAVETALSNEAGKMEFYLDPTNNGNFSLNVDAMPPNYFKTSIETRDAAAECASLDGQRPAHLLQVGHRGF